MNRRRFLTTLASLPIVASFLPAVAESAKYYSFEFPSCAQWPNTIGCAEKEVAEQFESYNFGVFLEDGLPVPAASNIRIGQSQWIRDSEGRTYDWTPVSSDGGKTWR